MKRLVMFAIISLFLFGFVAAFNVSITSGAVRNNTLSASSNQVGLNDSDDEGESESNLQIGEQERERIKESLQERLKERDKEKAIIEAKIKGTQTIVQIKKIFYTTSTNQDDIITEIIAKFTLNKTTANSLLKIEEQKMEEEENQEGVNEEKSLDIKVMINNGFARVKIEKNFVLDTIDKEEILNAIVEKSVLTADEIKSAMEIKNLKKVIQERNRFKFTNNPWECPTECTCTGSTIKCTLASGREMTIIAGKSGNMIVQIKGENMTTNVTLYKSDGKLYGVFRDNETRLVRMLPDQVKERIRERVQAMLQNENITLNEDGTYNYTAQKRARLFFIFPVRMMVRAEIDAETGEVIKVSKPKWWGFLAKDEEQFTLGASCGTVTPGENDNCCKNKGYDIWDTEKNECDFSE